MDDDANSFGPKFAHDLQQTSWTFYGVGLFIILLRLFARTRRHGFKGLAFDDYLMVAALACYTTLIVCLNVIVKGGGSNLYTPAEYESFTPEDIQERIKGSKIVVGSEQAMIAVIYTLKACILLMYHRITGGALERTMVKYVSIYISIGFCATEIAFFLSCRPLKGYWAVPPPNPQCATLQHYAIVQACFNISGDLLMIAIPIPMIVKLRLPLKQKLGLGAVFSLGTFVIIAAVLTKYYNLSNVWSPTYMLWYIREASVAVYVANIPMIWPLIRELFPCLRAITELSHGLPTYFKRNSASANQSRPSHSMPGHENFIRLEEVNGRQEQVRSDGKIRRTEIAIDENGRVYQAERWVSPERETGSSDSYDYTHGIIPASATPDSTTTLYHPTRPFPTSLPRFSSSSRTFADEFMDDVDRSPSSGWAPGSIKTETKIEVESMSLADEEQREAMKDSTTSIHNYRRSLRRASRATSRTPSRAGSLAVENDAWETISMRGGNEVTIEGPVTAKKHPFRG
ncbi:hypothetical protein K402DRAFT_349569 [Aulographum hederae CBS 113979]|uniref:Rhodopsin domain-containing protein n=1 Tax=Aulographum hederae CBS 113979 TaxID=1176131 RepID=A0A6G1H9B2_9PEZI|nr:hypothetical protein K402DRAFT_349569 [Aulographum hederae CBS 113979]